MELSTPSAQSSIRPCILPTTKKPVPSAIDQEKDVKYHNVDCDIAHVDGAGGDCQEKDVLVKFDRGHIVFKQDKLPLDWGARMVKNEYELIQDKFSRLDCPITLNPQESTFDDVAMHALFRQRLSPGTVKRNMRYARFMETHQMPVDFRNPSYENFIRHMDYREQIEGSQWGALKHEWQAMRMFLKAWSFDLNSWSYKPPKRAIYQVISLPYPDQVYQMLHQEYCKDTYENALVKYLLCHNFIIGWRVPSEPTIMKTIDVDVDNGTMIVTQPKLNNATKMLDIAEIATRHTTFSFKNWIDRWRPKVENRHSKDYLYLKPTGEPFADSEQLRMFLNRKANIAVKQIFSKHYNYLTRHWCAVARLIRTKIESKKYDEYVVSEWLGHTHIQTTMDYIKSAEFYYKKYPYDWIKRVLKFHAKNVKEENTLKSINPLKTLVTSGNNRSRNIRRLPDSDRRPLG